MHGAVGVGRGQVLMRLGRHLGEAVADNQKLPADILGNGRRHADHDLAINQHAAFGLDGRDDLFLKVFKGDDQESCFDLVKGQALRPIING